jgi:CelD/BcsL family acetyltransferase involved in cellulose biosynthesis
MQISYANAFIAPAITNEESEFYETALPDFIWPALEKLYHSIFCSEPHLRLNGSLANDTCAWVRRKEGKIIALLLFTRENSIVKVINEVITLSSDDLSKFSQALFKHDETISAIIFHAVKCDPQVNKSIPYLSICKNYSEDFVLSLPEEEKKWLEQLSKQTREKIRYHTRRSQRKQADLIFKHAIGSQICEADVSAIIEMNRARMKIKGRKFGLDSVEENNLRALLRERGLVSMMHADGRLCAGLLSTVCDKDVFMHVIAHDPDYDDLRLGFLCCCQTIQLCITNGMQRFHFLWGEYEYKTRLGGQRQALMDLVIVKSSWHTMLHPKLVGRIWLGSLRQIYRNWRKKNQGVQHVR